MESSQWVFTMHWLRRKLVGGLPGSVQLHHLPKWVLHAGGLWQVFCQATHVLKRQPKPYWATVLWRGQLLNLRQRRVMLALWAQGQATGQESDD